MPQLEETMTIFFFQQDGAPHHFYCKSHNFWTKICQVDRLAEAEQQYGLLGLQTSLDSFYCLKISMNSKYAFEMLVNQLTQMLSIVWYEINYRLDVCRITSGTRI
jgi:hypothetical protein